MAASTASCSGRAASAGREPDVSFREVANPFPDDDARAWTLAVGAADLDRDGLAELYFANDFGPDTLYVNRSTPGHVRLVPLRGRKEFFIPKSRVLGYDSFKGMGVDFGDVNGDGFFDLFVSNIDAEYAIPESHFLWLSTGDIGAIDDGVAPYVDRGEELGVARSSWGWDSRFADFDNDGVQEAIQATGFLKGTIDRWPLLAELAIVNDRLVHDPAVWPFVGDEADISGHDPNPFYARGKDGRFVEISGRDRPRRPVEHPRHRDRRRRRRRPSRLRFRQHLGGFPVLPQREPGRRQLPGASRPAPAGGHRPPVERGRPGSPRGAG